MKKCNLTQSGKHIFGDRVLSKTIWYKDQPKWPGDRESYSVEYFFRKCSACGFIDDTKDYTKAQLEQLFYAKKNSA